MSTQTNWSQLRGTHLRQIVVVIVSFAPVYCVFPCQLDEEKSQKQVVGQEGKTLFPLTLHNGKARVNYFLIYVIMHHRSALVVLGSRRVLLLPPRFFPYSSTFSF